MKYTLSSQEYNDLFRQAADTFDAEMLKRDIIIQNMSKKLMIINYTNEFVENKLSLFSTSTGADNDLITLNNAVGGFYNQYGFSVHPKFKNDPIDIFNLKLMSGNTMFKNSITCKVNDIQLDSLSNKLSALIILI